MGCQTNEGGKEGRREEFERGFNPAQFLATKSEIMMGDLGPLLPCGRQNFWAEGRNSTFCLSR